MPYKSRVDPNTEKMRLSRVGSSIILFSCIITMNQSCFLSLSGSLTKSQTFSPDWHELSLIRAELGPNGEKIWFSRAGSSIS